MPANTEHATTLIESTGASPTPARVQILGMLLAAESAWSHQALRERAAAAGQPLDKVTLYRVLDWLIEQGLVHSVTGQDRVRRFSATRSHANHAHFECDRCGRLYCLPAAASTPETPPGFETRHMNVTLNGHCAECAHPNRSHDRPA